MGKFSYTAMNTKGKEVTGVIDALTTKDAIDKIREMGFFPTNVTEDKKTAKSYKLSLSSKSMSARKKKAKPKELVMFTRQLSTLINAGVPLLRCLRVIKEQTASPGFSALIEEMANAIEAGSTFSEALNLFPKTFSPLYTNMVKAGEAAGALDRVLQRIADFLEKALELKQKVKSALVYPAFVIGMAICVLFFLVTFVVPKFADMLEDLDVPLPAITQFVISVSKFLQNYWYTVPLIIFAVIFLFRTIFLKSKAGKRIYDKVTLEFPVFGELMLKLYIARFTRTLSTLINAGVPLLQSINIVKDTVTNVLISNEILDIHDAVREGEPIVEPLKKSPIFSPMVVSMVDIGEESGSLPEMLEKIADNFDDDVDNTINALTSLLEPFLIVILAVIVGTIVISLFLPMIRIIEGLAK